MRLKCDICNTIFDTKQHLLQHQNKKNKCNITTPFKCVDCNKYFKYNVTLNRHKNICKFKISNENLFIIWLEPPIFFLSLLLLLLFL